MGVVRAEVEKEGGAVRRGVANEIFRRSVVLFVNV